MSGPILLLHVSADAHIATALAAALRPRGLAVTLLPADTQPRFRRGQRLAVLFSAAAATSAAIGRDLVLAQRAGLAVITVRLEAIEPDPAFDTLLGDHPPIDLFAGWDQGLDAIAATVTLRPAPALFEPATPGFQRQFTRRRRRVLRPFLRRHGLRLAFAAMVLAIPLIAAFRLGLFDPPPLPGPPLSTASLQQPAPAVLEVAAKGDAAFDRKDYAEALRWYRLAAGGNDPGAQTQLGRLFADGLGVPRDDAQAIVWYRTAAFQGYARAMNNLGTMYALGRGTLTDLGTALRWFHAAADRGSPQGAYNIGVAYETGGGVTQSFAEARDWYTTASTRGYGRGFTALARMQENGLGTKPDIHEALRLYIEGAERHDMSATLALVRLYSGTEGIEPNLDQALFWLRQAAEDGNPEAMFSIGTLDAARPEPERAERGLALIRRAAAAGHEPAAAWLLEHP